MDNILAPERALQPKDHLTGKVVKTTIAGAILDIGQKVPGVVHISQLQREPVNRVEDVVQPGQSVEVWVRRVRDDRIELTMIEPLGLEWNEIKENMIVRGKVARLESYGAFVDIGAERPGLVHISEISHDYIKSPAEVLKEGDEVEAKVLEVNRKKKQIRLSIKAATPKPEEIMAEVNRGERKGRGRRGKKQQEDHFEEEAAEREPELTAFQIAFQKAQERANQKPTIKAKRDKATKLSEREEIFDRTLKNRITDK